MHNFGREILGGIYECGGVGGGGGGGGTGVIIGGLHIRGGHHYDNSGSRCMGGVTCWKIRLKGGTYVFSYWYQFNWHANLISNGETYPNGNVISPTPLRFRNMKMMTMSWTSWTRTDEAVSKKEVGTGYRDWGLTR